MSDRVVLTKYDADASGQIREVGKLRKALEDHAKSVASMAGDIDGLWENGKRALGNFQAAYQTLAAAHDVYADRLKKMTIVGAADLEKLNKAYAGTRNTVDLLNDAAKLSTGVFKLNADAMATVALAERQLIREGADAEKVHAALTEALTKGTVDGLRPFGIAVDLAGASMADANGRAKIYSATMDQLKKLAGDAGLAHRTASEDIAAASAKNENSLTSVKNSIGSVVDALRPLTSVAGEALGGLARLLDEITNATRRQAAESLRLRSIEAFRQQYSNANFAGKSEFDSREFGGFIARQTGYDPRVMQSIGIGGIFDQAATGRFAGADTVDKTAALAAPAVEVLSSTLGKLRETLTGGYQGGGGSGGAIAAVQTLDMVLSRVAKVSNENSGIGLSLGGATTLGGMNTLGSAAGYANVQTSDLTAANSNALTANWKGRVAGYEKDRKTFMESTFGPVGQFDAYKAGWDGFTNAVTAGYNAMVDGSMSFGKAFKQAVAGALKATGAQMLIESLKEAAYGVANLAVGNAPGAAAHFKSSALFAAGSIAAGVAANQLGGGGGGGGAAAGGAGAGGGAPSKPAANSNANPQSSIVYVVGDPFDTEANPRRRQNNAKRLLDEVGMRSSMGGSY